MRNNIFAQRVWTSGDESIIIPEVFGKPREDQLCGTVGEQLIELAGRSCYDSLGQGRSSEDYHQHIIDVNHGSVWEHYNITVRYYINYLSELAIALVNRPGVWVEPDNLKQEVRVTYNPRVVIDWDKIDKANYLVFESLSYHMHKRVPQIVKKPSRDCLLGEITKPITDNEIWISMFMSGSRGFSHEQVRHGDFTAISQRSTRYVDESQSEWVLHPLIKKYINESKMINGFITQSKNLYTSIAKLIQLKLIDEGESKLNARKQARGAARGLLGNALYTEMIFSANLAQWKRMIEQRANPAADLEIRELYENYVMPELV